MDFFEDIAILCCLGSYAICHIGSDILGKCPSVIAEITGENDNGSEKDNKLGIKENKVNKLGIKENNKKESELKRTDVNAENISNSTDVAEIFSYHAYYLSNLLKKK